MRYDTREIEMYGWRMRWRRRTAILAPGSSFEGCDGGG